MPTTAQQRQSAYRQRLQRAEKTIMRIVVSRDVAQQLRSLALQHMEPIDRVLARALHALEAVGVNGGAR